MEGRVDENNRSLPPNPFVSSVLIHPSRPSHHHPPLLPTPSPPASLILPQPLLHVVHPALPAHQHRPAGTHTCTPRWGIISSTLSTTKENTTRAQLRPCFHPVFSCLFGGFFVLGIQTHPTLASFSACVCMCVRESFSFLCMI